MHSPFLPDSRYLILFGFVMVPAVKTLYSQYLFKYFGFFLICKTGETESIIETKITAGMFPSGDTQGDTHMMSSACSIRPERSGTRGCIYPSPVSLNRHVNLLVQAPIQNLL